MGSGLGRGPQWLRSACSRSSWPGAQVDAEVFALRPDYRALLLVVDGLEPGPSDEASETLLQAAEVAAREVLRDQPVERLPHVAAWREAYRPPGAKPQRTRNSLEASCGESGVRLALANRLGDHNAASVPHQCHSAGRPNWATSAPRGCSGANGTEPFDTVATGAAVIEYLDPGEVV